MASPRDLRQRIRSVHGTAQITRAMQMVAASKMRKAQQATLATRPFGGLLYRIQRRAVADAGDLVHPLLEVREVRKRAVILFGPDKGLCGSLSSSVFRVALQFDPTTTVFITAGKRATQFIARTGRRLIAEFTFGDSPRFAEARPIAALARDLFLKREVDQVQVVATRFINTLTQQPGVFEFLPIGKIAALEVSDAGAGADTTPRLFEPDTKAVLGYLFGHYLNIYLYRAMLEAKASEHSARMVAMKNATDNATELIRHLTLEYNTLRQGNITQELLEIAGGQLGNE
jgi:F-type H+-transporting ATPase subunit gamma